MKIRLSILAFILLSSSYVNFGKANAVSSENTICLPIVMYHEVKTFHLGKDVISPQDFENDLLYLAENKYTTITMNDLIDYFYNGQPLPSKPIILTFDDGYLNNYKYVLPLIKKYDMKIVLSLIVKNTNDFSTIPDDNLDYSHVTWEQLNEMIATGLVEVQNHSYNLHKIKYDSSMLFEDVMKAQNEIFMMTGKTPTTFSYPYGRYSENIDTILKSTGIKATLTCQYGINYISRETTKDLYRLKRICRSHNYKIGDLINDAIDSRL